MTNALDPNQQSFQDAGLSPDLNVWLTRNLTSLQRAGLSSGLTYDFANTDSSVLRTLNETDASVPTPAKPSVLGTVFSHVMNTQNHLVPIGDMKSYQDRLGQLGYTPPGYTASGIYDPQTANAHRLLGDSVAQQINSGEGGFMSSTPGKALNLLFNASMPTHIAKGIFGMVHNLVSSAFGTVKRLAGAVAAPLMNESYGKAWGDLYHHLGEDALNVISVAGMFTGISEMFDAGRAGLGLLGAVDSTGEAAASWMAKHGIEEGVGAFTRPAAEELMANPSISNRIAQWGLQKVPGVGGQMADTFGQTVARYGPRAINEIPAVKVLGGFYSGAAKAAFIPQVAAIYDPHGKLGKAVNEAPTLPWYADLPAMIVHPVDGVIPKVKDFMRLFRISDFGHLDPLRGLTDETVTDNMRTALNAQAYAKYQAARSVGQSAKSAAALVDSEPGVMGEEFSNALHGEIGGNALHDADNPARGIRPEYQQAANAWAEQHPYLIRKHFLEITTSAQYREAQGLVGHQPLADYLEATNAANTLTSHIQQGLPAFIEADAKVQEAQRKLDALKSVFNAGDHPSDALLPADLKFKLGTGPWQNAITRASEDLADAKQEAQQASIAHMVPHQEPVLAGYNYDTTPIMGKMGPEDPGVNVTKRVLIMRGDNPADRAGLLDLLKRWNSADPAGQAALQPELNRLNLGAVKPARVAANLEAMARVAAEDVTDRLPPEWQQQFRSLGYKAVLGGHDVLLPTDIDPTALSATKYGKLAYGLSSFGVSPIAADQRDIAALTRSAKARALDEYLFSEAGGSHPLGSGTAVLQSAERQRLSNLDALENMAQQSRGQRMLARMQKTFQAHEITVPEYQQGLQQALGVDKATASQMAPQISHVMRQAAASPGLLRTPNETYGVLARLGDALRVHGWQGFSEYIRSIQIGNDGKWGDILHKLPLNHYGDLPNNLMKGAMSLRFSLNPMFEARYAAKQPFLTMTAEDLPYELMPKRAMARLSDASGRDIQTEANTILARARGGNPKQLDDMEKQALDSGIFGYNAQNHQKYDAWRLYQREYMKAGGTADELRGLSGNGGDFTTLNQDADRTAIKYLQDDPKHVIAGGYGPRAPLEKSINSVFFPFSFEKKLLTQTADWFSSEPVRIMLAHHAMQMVNQWDTIGPDHQSKIARIMKKYVPVFNEVQKLNAFAHGVSPGEFGGVYGPLAQSMGVGVGAVMGALHPVGVNNTNADKFQKLMPRLVPGWTAVHNAVNDAVEQAQIATGAKSETTKAQIDDYFTKLRDVEQQASDTALIFGATPTVRGFTDSQQVPQALKSQYEQEKMILQQRYPNAAAYALKYGNTQAANDLAIQTVLGKVQKSPLDNGVLAMEVLRSQLGSLPTAQTGGAPAAQLLQRQLEQTSMRNEGLRLYNLLGPAWNDLWIHLGYQHEFGPITEQVA